MVHKSQQPRDCFKRFAMRKIKVGIVQYGAGNQASVINALERIGAITMPIRSTSDIDEVDKLIIPGVGHAGKAMAELKQTGLDSAIRKSKIPLLGICLGMQLLGKSSSEGNISCLEIADYNTVKFNVTLKVPHIGWNQVKLKKNPLFHAIPNNEWFYFVHGYYIPNSKHTIAKCTYEVEFTAAVQLENFWGVQFHPEKSGETGLQVLKNFIELCK